LNGNLSTYWLACAVLKNVEKCQSSAQAVIQTLLVDTTASSKNKRIFGDRLPEKSNVLRTLKPFSQLLGDLRNFFIKRL
jgi:hypothetical protein